MLHPARVLGCTLHLLELASDEECGHLLGDTVELSLYICVFASSFVIYRSMRNIVCCTGAQTWIGPLELPKQWKMCAGYGTLGALRVCVGQGHCKQ